MERRRVRCAWLLLSDLPPPLIPVPAPPTPVLADDAVAVVALRGGAFRSRLPRWWCRCWRWGSPRVGPSNSSSDDDEDDESALRPRLFRFTAVRLDRRLIMCFFAVFFFLPLFALPQRLWARSSVWLPKRVLTSTPVKSGGEKGAAATTLIPDFFVWDKLVASQAPPIVLLRRRASFLVFVSVSFRSSAQ